MPDEHSMNDKVNIPSVIIFSEMALKKLTSECPIEEGIPHHSEL